MHTTFRIRFPISFWNLTDKEYIALVHKEQWQLLNNTGQNNLEKCSVNMPGTFSCKKDDLIWLWFSQGMQLIMCDDAIYSVLAMQIQRYTKEAGLLLGWDFTRQLETQAGCASPRGGAQARIQPMRRCESRGTRQEMSTSSPAQGWSCISSSEQSPVVSGNYLCPDCHNWQHAMVYLPM